MGAISINSSGTACRLATVKLPLPAAPGLQDECLRTLPGRAAYAGMLVPKDSTRKSALLSDPRVQGRIALNRASGLFFSFYIDLNNKEVNSAPKTVDNCSKRMTVATFRSLRTG
jgi:hypothetical protein